jgi:hypothetical protein
LLRARSLFSRPTVTAKGGCHEIALMMAKCCD